MEHPTPSPVDQDVHRPQSVPATSLRVLLVEDNEADAELILRALTRGGYDVTFARVDTEEQMRTELARVEWDIVIADYYLSTLDGMAALKLLQSSGKAIPFILISGTVDDETAIEVVRAGARDYVRKDQPARLVAAVRRELDAARIYGVQPVSGVLAAPRMWRRLGISSRLMVGFIVATFLFTALGVWHAIVYKRASERTVTTEAEQIARHLSVSVAQLDKKAGTPDLLFDRPALLQELVEEWARLHKRNIEIVDAHRRIVADVITKDIGTTFTNDEGNEVALTMRDGRARTFVEKSADYPAGIRQMVVPIQVSDGKIVGAMLFDYTTVYQREMRESAARARWFMITGVVVLAIVAGVGWATSRSVTKPLHHLRAAAHRLGRQELDTPISIECADEVGELAVAFEQMRVNLIAALHARANLERTLAERSQALRTVIDMAPVAGMVLDPGGVVQLWNLEAERSYGWHEREVLNRPVPGIPPDKREEYEALCKRVAAGEVITGWETTRLTKAGTPVEITLSLSPLRDSYGTVTGIISTAIDNTDRKRAAADLAAAHTELAQLYETTKDLAARWEALFTLSRMLNRSLELDEVFGTFARAVESYVPYDRLGVILQEGEQLRTAYAVAHPPLVSHHGQSWSKTNDTAVEWILDHGEPRLVRDLGTGAAFRDERYLAQEGVRSVLGLPLLAGGEVLGIFFLDSLTAETYASRDIERLLPLADQVAIVIEHSRLWNAVQRHADKLKREVEERQRVEAALLDANREISASMRALESRTTELRLLHEMTDLMQSSISVDEAHNIMYRYLARLFPRGAGALYIRSTARDLLERTSAWGKCAAELTPAFAAEECWALRRGQPHCVRIGQGDVVCRHTAAADGGERVCLPLLAHGETLGILYLCRCEGDDVSLAEPALLALAETVANSLSLSIGNLQLRERLRQQSIRDALTGLYNRRYLDETLPREILRAERAGATLGVIMLDIDHFKRLNDTRGHEAGDAVLSALGRFLQHHVRGDDIACRYGGEEFTLILPGASLDTVCNRAERLRAGAQSLAVRVVGTQLDALTLSLGVAVWPQHGETAEAVLQAADAALYRAKQGGRNRVEIAA